MTEALPRHQAVCMGTLEYYGNALYLHTRRHPLITPVVLCRRSLKASFVLLARSFLSYLWLFLPSIFIVLVPNSLLSLHPFDLCCHRNPPSYPRFFLPRCQRAVESAAVVTHGSLGHIQRSVDHPQSTIFRSVVWSHGRS